MEPEPAVGKRVLRRGRGAGWYDRWHARLRSAARQRILRRALPRLRPELGSPSGHGRQAGSREGALGFRSECAWRRCGRVRHRKLRRLPDGGRHLRGCHPGLRSSPPRFGGRFGCGGKAPRGVLVSRHRCLHLPHGHLQRRGQHRASGGWPCHPTNGRADSREWLCATSGPDHPAIGGLLCHNHGKHRHQSHGHPELDLKNRN